MKKLKTFDVQDATVLSRKEMAVIEGGVHVELLDYCTVNDNNMPCVYAKGVDGAGHSYVVLGTCHIHYEQVGSHIVSTYASCD